MTAFLVRGRRLALVAVLAMAVALAACSGDNEPEAPDTPEPTPTAAAETDEAASTDAADDPAETDEPAAADADDESAAAQAAAPGGAAEIRVDRGTTWQEVFDALTDAEQSCVRDAVGDEALASGLSERVLTEADLEPWQADLLTCLSEPAAYALFFGIMVAAAEEEGVTLNAEERSCLRGVVEDLDVADLIAAISGGPEDAAATADFAQGMIACLPDVMLRGMFEGAGVSYDDLSEEQRDCLRDLITGADFGGLLTGEPPEDPEAFGALLEDLLACAPDMLAIDEGFDGGAAPADDDHADAPEDATPALVGASVEGALQGGGDTDMFVFAAEEGVFYHIDVELGSLDDSILRLLDADGWELAYNDDYGESYASRIEWEAPATGDYYLAVEGWGLSTGSYTLTITVIPAPAPGQAAAGDDHADTLDGATPASVGGSIEGTLHQGNDVDVFAFEAEEGALYRIDVVLGSLGDSVLTLYDADGRELAFNDDYGDSTASRIDWQAPDACDYYIALGAWGGATGSYTLDITVFVERGSDE